MSNDSPLTKLRSIEGVLVVPEGAKFALVASRFNHFIVDRLVEGAVDALVRHGAKAENITLVRVPGSWEVPVVCARIAERKQVDDENKAAIEKSRKREQEEYEYTFARIKEQR